MATRADVARVAGVSEAAVSYAISGKRPISDATRSRIFAAMRDLDYRPNAMARGLAGGKSMIIALLFPTRERGMSNADLEYVLGAANTAREQGYHLMLWPTDGLDVLEALALQKGGMIDGVLLMEVQMEDERVDILVDAGVPLGLIGRTADAVPGVVAADRDFERVADRAVAHLADLGHRRIAMIGGSTSTVHRRFGAVLRAENGFEDACRRRGLTPHIFHVDSSVDAGRILYDEHFTADPEYTGIVAMNADAVVGFMAAAQNHAERIPRELSVISIGTPDNLVALTVPPLTTISPPARAIGAAAAKLLIARIGGAEQAPPPELWAGELEVRGSTGPAPRVSPENPEKATP